MIAGGLGNVRRKHVEKGEIPVGAKLVVLGGPAMLIGLGGGAASSMNSGASQRGSRFRLRAARQPGDAAARAGSHRPLLARWTQNPILLDPRRGRRRSVERGARGGRAHARPRRASSTCARFRATSPACRRWRSGATRRRSATCCHRRREARRLRGDLRARALPVRRDRRDRRHRRAGARRPARTARGPSTCRSRCCSASRRGCCATCAARRRRRRRSTPRSSTCAKPRTALLRFPAVADKTFLITIGDRTVGGMISRDQMVGPVAGAGGRRRRDDRRLLRPHRRGDGDGRAHAGRGARRARLRAGSRSARRSPTFSRPTSARCRT